MVTARMTGTYSSVAKSASCVLAKPRKPESWSVATFSRNKVKDVTLNGLRQTKHRAQKDQEGRSEYDEKDSNEQLMFTSIDLFTEEALARGSAKGYQQEDEEYEKAERLAELLGKWSREDFA
jgi:hypothetical protein